MKKLLIILLVAVLIVGGILYSRSQNQDGTVPPAASDTTPASGTADASSPAEPGGEVPAEPQTPSADEPAEETPAEEPQDGSSSDGEKGGETVSVPVPDEDGWYYDLENVTAYLMAYGKLPSNYITKQEAEALGWTGGSVQRYREGAAIGGGRFGNYEGLLPDGKYTECDIDTDGSSSRGAKRLVFSSDGRYYYTDDHYETFSEVTFENGELVLNDDY